MLHDLRHRQLRSLAQTLLILMNGKVEQKHSATSRMLERRTMKMNNKCTFHVKELNNRGTDTQNRCLFVDKILDCDGVSIEYFRRCPLWGELA